MIYKLLFVGMHFIDVPTTLQANNILILHHTKMLWCAIFDR